MTSQPNEDGLPPGATESTLIRVAKRVRNRHWSDHILIGVVVLATTLVAADFITDRGAKLVQGLVSGLYAWGYLRPKM